jgi:hypothetical protein
VVGRPSGHDLGGWLAFASQLPCAARRLHAPGRAPDHGFAGTNGSASKSSAALFAQTHHSPKPGSGARRRAWEAPSSAGRGAARALARAS